MVIWGVMAWWYTEGWHQCLLRLKERIEGALDFFSIDLLIKTLFAPYRQIAAAQVRGSLDVRIRAFFDRLFSRFVGMTVRLIMIAVGLTVVALSMLGGAAVLLFWAIVPILPLIGLLLFLAEWMPWVS